MIFDEEGQSPISLVADFSGDISSLFELKDITTLPLLPLRNMMLLPAVVAPVSIGRSSSRMLIDKAVKSDQYIGVFCQKDANVDVPQFTDLYNIGVLAKVIRRIELPDGNCTAILQCFDRIMLTAVTRQQPYLRGKVLQMEEKLPEKNDKEFAAVADEIKDAMRRLAKLTENASESVLFAVRNMNNPVFLVNFIASHLPIEMSEKLSLMKEGDVKQRAYLLLELLNREIQFAALKRNIQHRTRTELDKQQKDFFLQQEMKNIREELGEDESSDTERLREKANAAGIVGKEREIFDRELEKLGRISNQSPDYNVQVNYLETFVSLPWNKQSEDNTSITAASKRLDADHYGLEKVKERILEHLAVLKFRGDLKSPILCLYGPPGVGKTSLGRSIAEALGRKYVRISLGGVHDEAEIRGHRRTYVGAMPGRIIKGLAKAGTSNPVFILDEIDKVSENNHSGDPQSALLEVLDPEQNVAFHDNFLDVDFDLSHVMFIATANNPATIPAPLRDRMEMIEVDGYLQEEKYMIARHYLIPKAKAEFHLPANIQFQPATINKIIEDYTRESGVRSLEKQINKVFRKMALKLATISETAVRSSYTIRPGALQDLLGKPLYNRDRYEGEGQVGVVTGLAWTAVGGEILFVETSLSKSKTPRLTLTGNLGDVMKESATLALEYVKAHAADLAIDPALFEEWSIHLHVPEGATPKDGPSAGITMATSIASALTQRKVRRATAMTGEITLRGKVLPVGGIKEKILAAKRAGITDIVICKDNQRDIDDIKPEYIDGLHFEYVENVSEVLNYALC
ncbi:MAG: endopeptidase La [Bacteroidales bacterium]|nr:endopeptidase La [Bacteroidales bacterium]